MNFTVPETMTSWVLSAVATNDNFGLAIFDDSFTFNAFKKFFIVLNLPYSVKINETLMLEIYIHSYLDTDLLTTVKLEDTWDFESIGYKHRGWKRKEF